MACWRGGREHDGSEGEDHLEKKASSRLTASEPDAAEGHRPVQRWVC